MKGPLCRSEVFGLILGLLAASALGQTSVPAKGQLVFQTDFEGTNALQGWGGKAALEAGYASSQSVAIESQPGRNGATLVRQLPVESLRGCTLRCSAMVLARNVSAKPNPWNGIKFMLVTEGASGKTYPQAPLSAGSFDWQRATFSAPIPADATNLTLVLGLEQVSGKAGFDALKIVVAKAPVARQPGPVAGPRFKGHSLPRLRGAMISPGIDPESLRVLGRDWNANLIRWQLIRPGRSDQADSLDTYDAWLEGELKKLDAALPYCQQYGLHVVLDLHSPPGGKGISGGYVAANDRFFTDKACQDKFVQIWQRLATRYKEAKPIWGYDLVNEPVEDYVEEGCDDWQGLAERAARAIRAIDPQRAIIVEPIRWGGPDGLNDLVPLPVSNVVYSVHMYLPHAFTHQNVHAKGPAYSYPGDIAGKPWDKAQLERALQPVIDFQQRYNVHIYIGEFSAIRWAPDQSACRYLSDLIDIFEAQGWDWSYHAFREWNGWSVEHGANPQDTRPASTPTDRQQLLFKWFGRNQKPSW